jgi:hypothetical protein
MGIIAKAFFLQILILGGGLNFLQLVNTTLFDIAWYVGIAYSLLRPVPNDFLYPKPIIRWQLPFIRIRRAVQWWISAFIAWAVIRLILAMFGLV